MSFQGCDSLASVISAAMDIARGCEYIHSVGIIHGDLKWVEIKILVCPAAIPHSLN